MKFFSIAFVAIIGYILMSVGLFSSPYAYFKLFGLFVATSFETTLIGCLLTILAVVLLAIVRPPLPFTKDLSGGKE